MIKEVLEQVQKIGEEIEALGAERARITNELDGKVVDLLRKREEVLEGVFSRLRIVWVRGLQCYLSGFDGELFEVIYTDGVLERVDSVEFAPPVEEPKKRKRKTAANSEGDEQGPVGNDKQEVIQAPPVKQWRKLVSMKNGGVQTKEGVSLWGSVQGMMDEYKGQKEFDTVYTFVEARVGAVNALLSAP